MNINKFIFIFLLLYLSNIENYFLSYSDEKKYNNTEELKNYKNISISYGLNNNNFYPTLVSITSILENANNSTFYIINILVSKKRKDFSEKNKRKFKDLENQYKRCEIIIFRINIKIIIYIKINLIIIFFNLIYYILKFKV